MVKVAFIGLFFSTAASASIPPLCVRLWRGLVPATSPSRTAVLEQKIVQKFSVATGLRIKTIERAAGVSEDDYFAGLSNLNQAVHMGLWVPTSLKFDSIYITRRGGVSVRLDIFGEPYVSVPHDMSPSYFPLTLFNNLLEFGIERKIRKRRGILGIVGGSENFSDELEYGNALENLYFTLSQGPIPEELGKLYEINLTTEDKISFSFWSSDISNEGFFRASLNVPARVAAAGDLEEIAIAVLEAEVTSRLAKNYSWRGYRKDIDNVMVVEDGVDRSAYKRMLRKLIARLIDNSLMLPTRKGPRQVNTYGVDLSNLGRIYITEAGNEFSSHRYLANDGTPQINLSFPVNAVIDLFFIHQFLARPSP